MQSKTAISYIDNINELCLAEIESLLLQSTLCMLYCDKFTCTRHIHSKTGCVDITSQTSKTFLMGIHLPLRKIFVHIQVIATYFHFPMTVQIPVPHSVCRTHLFVV